MTAIANAVPAAAKPNARPATRARDVSSADCSPSGSGAAVAAGLLIWRARATVGVDGAADVVVGASGNSDQSFEGGCLSVAPAASSAPTPASRSETTQVRTVRIIEWSRVCRLASVDRA